MNGPRGKFIWPDGVSFIIQSPVIRRCNLKSSWQALCHYAQHESVRGLWNVIRDKKLLFDTPPDYFKSQRKQPQWLRLIGRVPRALFKLHCSALVALQTGKVKRNVRISANGELSDGFTGLDNSLFVHDDQLVLTKALTKEQNFF